MKVFVKGSNQALNLTTSHFVAQGGQGSIYVDKKVAYKIYHDPAQMIPVGKIEELKVVAQDRIIRPQDILLNETNRPIGYSTRFVENSIPLCSLFPRAFRDREGITQDAILDLVRNLREGIEYIHSVGVLIVDLNEMNFLIDKGFEKVFFIDVDGYQTAHYPALALMDSVRDWSVSHNKWTEYSDWYSFAILAFQMFTGIHPFRGKYIGGEEGFKRRLPSDTADDSFAMTRRRMKGSISVFHPDVRCPVSAAPFSAIPSKYKIWFEDLFARGRRGAPPAESGVVVVVMSPPPTSPRTSGRVKFEEMSVYEGSIRKVWSCGSQLVVETSIGCWVGDKRVPIDGSIVACGLEPKTGTTVVLLRKKDSFSYYNLTNHSEMPFGVQALEATSYDGRIYLRMPNEVSETILTPIGSRLIVSNRSVANVLPHATLLAPGVIIQDMIGAKYVSLLTQSGMARQIRMKELDAYRILEAKFDHSVLMVVGEKKGQYDRLVFRFAADDTYDVRIVGGIPLAGLNFAVLDTGVCVCLNEEEELEIFSVRKDSAKVATIKDGDVDADIMLVAHGGALLGARGNKIYRLRLS